MSTIELYDRIKSWLWCYKHIPFEPSTDPQVTQFNKSVSQKWANEIWIDLTELDVPKELIGTPVEQDLRTANQYALAADRKNVKEIHELLSNVELYLKMNRLYPKSNPYN